MSYFGRIAQRTSLAGRAATSSVLGQRGYFARGSSGLVPAQRSESPLAKLDQRFNYLGYTGALPTSSSPEDPLDLADLGAGSEPATVADSAANSADSAGAPAIAATQPGVTIARSGAAGISGASRPGGAEGRGDGRVGSPPVMGSRQRSVAGEQREQRERGELREPSGRAARTLLREGTAPSSGGAATRMGVSPTGAAPTFGDERPARSAAEQVSDASPNTRPAGEASSAASSLARAGRPGARAAAPNTSDVSSLSADPRVPDALKQALGRVGAWLTRDDASAEPRAREAGAGQARAAESRAFPANGAAAPMPHAASEPVAPRLSIGHLEVEVVTAAAPAPLIAAPLRSSPPRAAVAAAPASPARKLSFGLRQG